MTEENHIATQNHTVIQKSAIEFRIERLELICEHMGEAVIAASETVEHLSSKIDSLLDRIEQGTEQTSEQGNQILALSESLQTLVEINSQSIMGVDQLTSTVRDLLPSEQSIEDRS
jgi:hypothetical protein